MNNSRESKPGSLLCRPDQPLTPFARNSEFIRFAIPDVGDEEIAEVVAVMRSGWITTGGKARQFETEIVALLRRTDPRQMQTVAVNSATAGLHLALEAIGIQSGDEVIVPTYTFTASAEVVRYLGAHPVLVDIDPRTLNVDPAAVEAAITPRTRAIMPVHIAGLACDMDRICDIARRCGLRVVEDAAHALPTTWRGRMIGALDTDACVFSFYANKTMTTGEGGMVVTRSEQIADRCRVMRLHGISRDAFDRYTSEMPSWHYEVIAPGFKYNLTDIAAAIGIQQLRKLGRFHERRVAIARQYLEAFRDLPVILPADAPAGDLHAWHLFILRLTADAPLDRATFIQQMAAAGIGTSVHFIPLHLHPYWRDTYRLTPEQFPNAQQAYEGAVSLPLYTRMTDADVARVIETVRRLLAR